MIARILAFIAAMTWAGAAWAACSSAGACFCSISLTSMAFGTFKSLEEVARTYQVRLRQEDEKGRTKKGTS